MQVAIEQHVASHAKHPIAGPATVAEARVRRQPDGRAAIADDDRSDRDLEPIEQVSLQEGGDSNAIRVSPDSTSVRAQTYSVGAESSVKRRYVGANPRPGSKTTLSGFGPGTCLTVSCGSSVATVPAPTTTAFDNARIRCR